MAAYKTKNYKVEFFVVTHNNSRKHSIFRDLLRSAKAGGYTAAIPLLDDESDKYQVRSLVAFGGGSSFQGIFGRCRFGDKPEQGTEDGQESDVELKPGHGLVEKNHFLFFADRNLLVYQRNPSGSHPGRFQRYANMATSKQIAFEPILTTDSYKRLIEGEDARIIDVSFQQPKDPSLYEDLWLKDAIKLVNQAGGVNARIRISVGRTNQHLVNKLKNAAVALAKGGIAKVARVTLVEEKEPIDLIVDRISETITVKLGPNGRPESSDIYAALQQAQTDRADDLKSFYGA